MYIIIKKRKSFKFFIMVFKKVDKYIKNNLKKSTKEKRRCQKLYPDWKDDEYNCGPLKYIWGVKSHDDLTLNNANFCTLNNLDIYYNRDTRKYLLNIDFIFNFTNKKDENIKYLNNLLDEFKDYILESNLFNVNFDPSFIYLYDNGELFIADSLTELYYKFKIFVKGYKQLWQ